MTTQLPRSPSAKAIEKVWPTKGREAKVILRMTRQQLDSLPALADLERRWAMSLTQLRMEALDSLLGGFGVEHITLSAGAVITYLNMGDTYDTTIMWLRGSYRLGCWGDIVEKEGDDQ